jgi:hypothetical protein
MRRVILKYGRNQYVPGSRLDILVNRYSNKAGYRPNMKENKMLESHQALLIGSEDCNTINSFKEIIG